MKYLLYACCFVLMDIILPREEKGCSCRGSYPDPEPAVRPEVVEEPTESLDMLGEPVTEAVEIALPAETDVQAGE